MARAARRDDRAMNKPRILTSILMGAFAGAMTLMGCETQGSGTGGGKVSGTSKPVAFTWQSSDSDSGNITATFGNGRVFKGTYLQVTSDTRIDELELLWDGWGRPYRRSSWRYWDADSRSDFIRTYSGDVLANLHSDDGEHMRCRFNLLSPQRGITGGGEGRCQFSESDQEIRAEFPRKGQV